MSLKKGIKGRLRLTDSEDMINIIKQNADALLEIVETEFSFCEYDIYEAEYNDENIICVDFNIMGHTFANCKSDLSYFKREIKRLFQEKPEEILTMSYDKI